MQRLEGVARGTHVVVVIVVALSFVDSKIMSSAIDFVLDDGGADVDPLTKSFCDEVL